MVPDQMHQFLAEYGLFLAKTATLIGGFLVFITAAYSASQRYRKLEKEGHIEVSSLNDKFKEMAFAVQAGILSEAAYQHLCKQEKNDKKAREKQEKRQLNKVGAVERQPRVFVLDFHGDIRASAANGLSECITAVLTQAAEQDEVVVRLESSGGLVHAYGLAASQLQRIRDKRIALTVCVDKVAASGGYMMACVADKVLAAPFAVVGSIGVIAQIPNFNRLLKKHDIDYEMLTAGEYKRTLTMLGENTDKARQKFQQEIDETHRLFKDFIATHRPAMDIASVATGETWLATKARDLGLVDQLMTSDEYLYARHHQAEIFVVEWVEKKTIPARLGLAADRAMEQATWRLLDILDSRGKFLR